MIEIVILHFFTSCVKYDRPRWSYWESEETTFWSLDVTKGYCPQNSAFTNLIGGKEVGGLQ